MALQADVLEGPTGAYIKVVETDKRTKAPQFNSTTGVTTEEQTFLVYEVAVYASQADRLADEEPWSQRVSAIHVDRFKIRDYTGTDPIADAYTHLKLQTDRVSNTKDV
jgi:hypothetical protein